MMKEINSMSDDSNQTNNPVNMMSETDALLYASTLLKSYREMESKLRKEYNLLINLKESFPVKYIEKDDFEDLLLKASNAKFKAILLARKLSGLSSEVEYELEYLISNFKLNIADEALSEKFDKITEGLRDAYVKSKNEIKEMAKLRDKISILADSSEKMIKMFDSDEINFRRIAEKKMRLLGFS